MTTSIHVLPTSERVEPDHSFIRLPGSGNALFTGWGPRL